MNDVAELAHFQDVSWVGWLVFATSVCLFATYWWHRYQTNGVMTTDVWFVFYYILAQNFLLLPFAYSDLNVEVLGSAIQLYIDNVDKVTAISVVGTLAFGVGAGFGWRRKSPLPGFLAMQNVVQRLLVGYRAHLWAIVFLAPPLVAFAAFGVEYGQARTAAQEDSSIQIINNFLNSAVQLILLVSICLWFFQRSKRTLYLVVLVLAASFYGGTRAASVWPMILAAAVLMHYRRIRNVLPFLAGSLLLVWVALLYAAFRNQATQIEAGTESFIEDLLFGGHLTEMRDFVWVYSLWDGEYLQGKTYVAGLLGFIPSSLSEFRTEWSWGKLTTRLIGFESESFSGLRLPIFGEVFFNFSFPGVVVVALVFGYVVFACAHTLETMTRRHGQTQKHALEPFAIVTCTAIYLNLIQLSLVSVTIFAVYIQIFALSTLLFFRKQQ